MNDPPVIGLVCEGISDLVVFQAILDDLFGTGYELRQINPAQRGRRAGKDEVQRWCEQNGNKLQGLIRGMGLDVLIVHLDADAGHALGATTTKALCATVKGWLGPGQDCPELVIAIPKQKTEAWLLAALGSPNPEIEEQRHPREQLIARGELLPTHEPWFRRRQGYEALAAQLGQQLARLLPAVPELDRFAGKLMKRRRARSAPASSPPSPAGDPRSSP